MWIHMVILVRMEERTSVHSRALFCTQWTPHPSTEDEDGETTTVVITTQMGMLLRRHDRPTLPTRPAMWTRQSGCRSPPRSPWLST